jgi:hypothetical protein
MAKAFVRANEAQPMTHWKLVWSSGVVFLAQIFTMAIALMFYRGIPVWAEMALLFLSMTVAQRLLAVDFKTWGEGVVFMLCLFAWWGLALLAVGAPIAGDVQLRP